MTRRSLRRVAVLASLLVAGWPASACADVEPNPVQNLCRASAVACSIQVDPTWTEGTAHEVVVTGNPGVTISLQAYGVNPKKFDELTAFGPTVTVTTDDHGFGMALLRLPRGRVQGEDRGGPLLLAPVDTQINSVADLAGILGTWTTLRSRYPLILGDGFAITKPVGEPLALYLAGVLPGSRFTVELDRRGKPVQVGASVEGCREPDASCVVMYEVPRGLAGVRHEARLIDTSSGAPVASWQVVPALVGEPTDLLNVTALPDVGTDVPGALTAGAGVTSNAVPRPRVEQLDLPVEALGDDSAGHRQGVVRAVAGFIAGLAFVFVVVGVRRRDA